MRSTENAKSWFPLSSRITFGPACEAHPKLQAFPRDAGPTQHPSTSKGTPRGGSTGVGLRPVLAFATVSRRGAAAIVAGSGSVAGGSTVFLLAAPLGGTLERRCRVGSSTGDAGALLRRSVASG